nr:MAG TPA: hypothetical protein [Caudoviricetes sp.]
MITVMNIIVIVRELKHTKLCTGLQGFVLSDSG